MTADFCNNHSELVSSVGEMNGKLDMLIQGQQGVKNDVNELYKLFNKSDKDLAIEHTKVAPVYWILGGIGMLAFNVLTAVIVAQVVR